MIEIVVNLIRILFGFLITMFLPGFAISLVLLRWGGINFTKRLALSSIFSITITVLVALFLDVFLGFNINFANMVLVLSSITTISIIIWFIKSGNFKKMSKILKKVKR